MKEHLKAINLLLFLAMLLSRSLEAQPISSKEALAAANKWIDLMIKTKGNWANSQTATIEEIKDFKRGERFLGYYCRIQPKGYIIISLRRELAPIKVYSCESDLDPDSNTGVADYIKLKMELLLKGIEDQLGPITEVKSQDLERILEIDCRNAWLELENAQLNAFSNYQEGDILLDTRWIQYDPYSSQCPPGSGNPDCPLDHCAVGCTAIAGAQVMRYWYWPPFGSTAPYADPYDWKNMPPELFLGSDPAHINAVAELCHEVGTASDMQYCAEECASDAYLADAPLGGSDLLDALEDQFRYNTAANNVWRAAHTAIEWFNLIKEQLNLNRPLPYKITKHAVVCDGWQEIGITPLRQYHMEYGGADNHTTWYTLDELYYPDGGGWPGDNMLVDIYPGPSLGNTISGSYPLESFPYRYFDQDATSQGATFLSGQHLQFLPGIVVKCVSTVGGEVRFEGSASNDTKLFTRGDESKGIRIINGAVKLKNNGSIKLR